MSRTSEKGGSRAAGRTNRPMPPPASAASLSRRGTTVPSRGPSRQSVTDTPGHRSACSAAHRASRRSAGRTRTSRDGFSPIASKAAGCAVPSGSMSRIRPGSARAASHAASVSVAAPGPQSSVVPPALQPGPRTRSSGPASEANGDSSVRSVRRNVARSLASVEALSSAVCRTVATASSPGTPRRRYPSGQTVQSGSARKTPDVCEPPGQPPENAAPSHRVAGDEGCRTSQAPPCVMMDAS